MPRFLTSTELKALRGEAEILRLAAGSEDALTAAINQGESFALSYLLTRYGAALPADPTATPDVLKAQIAVLAHRRLITSQVAPALDDEYKQAVKWLGDVARSIASLNLPEAPPVDQSTPAVLSSGPCGPGMTLKDLEHW